VTQVILARGEASAGTVRIIHHPASFRAMRFLLTYGIRSTSTSISSWCRTHLWRHECLTMVVSLFVLRIAWQRHSKCGSR